jgi:hypothetical protein
MRGGVRPKGQTYKQTKLMHNPFLGFLRNLLSVQAGIPLSGIELVHLGSSSDYVPHPCPAS